MATLAKPLEIWQSYLLEKVLTPYMRLKETDIKGGLADANFLSFPITSFHDNHAEKIIKHCSENKIRWWVTYSTSFNLLVLTFTNN